MFATDNGWLVADSARLWNIAVELGVIDQDGEQRDHKEGFEHPCATPLGTRRVIERVLADGGPFAHLLHFSHSGPEGDEIGGCSIAAIG